MNIRMRLSAFRMCCLIERELRQCKLDSAAMKPVEALDGKL